MPNEAYQYSCNKCNYKAIAFPSGSGHSMLYAFNMYICKDCKELVQVTTYDFSNITFGEIHPSKRECPECDSKNIELWDTKRRPCPKCDGTMVLPEDEVMVVMYD